MSYSKFIIILIVFYEFIQCGNTSNLRIEDNFKVQNPNLRIIFQADKLISFEKLVIKISKNVPKRNYSKRWMILNPLPIPFLVTSQEKIDIYEPEYLKEINHINSNEEISLKLDEGEYYVSIVNTQDSFFQFDVYETKNFKILFGFYRNDGKFFPSDNSEYDIIEFKKNHCINEFYDDLSQNIGNYSYCPKVSISNNETIIKLKFSPKEKTSLSTRINKYIFPGILYLGPINTGGAYYKRNLEVKIDSNVETNIKE